MLANKFHIISHIFLLFQVFLIRKASIYIFSIRISIFEQKKFWVSIRATLKTGVGGKWPRRKKVLTQGAKVLTFQKRVFSTILDEETPFQNFYNVRTFCHLGQDFCPPRSGLLPPPVEEACDLGCALNVSNSSSRRLGCALAVQKCASGNSNFRTASVRNAFHDC